MADARDAVAAACLPLLGLLLPLDKRFVLDQTAAAIEAVQALPHSTARLAVRIAKLDAELADVKIPDRARGLILKSETVAGFCGRGYFDRDISEAFYSDANLLAVSALPALIAAQSLHHIHPSRPRRRHQ